MNNKKILLVEDNKLIADTLTFDLEQEGFDVTISYDGQDALNILRDAMPDLVLLDVMLPSVNGWDVCREIRLENDVPIIMLTARNSEVDIVLGLELGADDYIVKPFRFRELLARIRANLRRTDKNGREDNGHDFDMQRAIKLGSTTFYPENHVVIKNGERIRLSLRERTLLVALLSANGRVVERKALMDKVWGSDWVGEERTLDVHIRRLRQKIEDDSDKPELITTVRGVGYQLQLSSN